MAGNALAGLAKAIGGRAERGIGNAKGSIFGVAQEAVRGQHAAEAQERNFGHSRQIIKDLHKNAGQGTGVDFHVQSGEHIIGGKYTKKMIGENFGEVQEKQAIKDFKAGNRPTRNAQGYRQDQPDHVGNAKGAIENKGMAPTSLVAIDNKPRLALDAPKTKGKAAGAEEGPDKTERFVTDSKGGTRRVDRRDGSFAEHLDANESKYLAERKAKVDSVRQAGVGIQSGGKAMNPENKMGEIVGNANQKFDDAKKRMDQKFDNLRNKTNVRIDNAAGARDSVPASYRNKPKGRPTTTPKSDEVF